MSWLRTWRRCTGSMMMNAVPTVEWATHSPHSRRSNDEKEARMENAEPAIRPPTSKSGRGRVHNQIRTPLSARYITPALDRRAPSSSPPLPPPATVSPPPSTMIPARLKKIDTSVRRLPRRPDTHIDPPAQAMSAEEQKLFRLYGKLPTHKNALTKMQRVCFFDHRSTCVR